MVKNYQELQAAYYPNNPCTCTGDCSNYASIVWAETPVLQVDLDSHWIEFLKNARCNEIDAKTQELIISGFSYDGFIFSMSINAQINWSNFPNIPESLFPLTIMDIDDVPYVLDFANKMSFYLSALGFKNEELQSGATLKMEIKSCTTEACINSIIDNR